MVASPELLALFACLSATLPMYWRLESSRLLRMDAQIICPTGPRSLEWETRSRATGGAQVQLLITGRRHRLHSLVVLDPVSNPLVVECLRGLIHDELQAHLLAPVASNDLDKAGGTTALLPKALAMLAHIAASGDTLLFANNLPRGDGASLFPPPSFWNPCPSQSSHFQR